MKKLLAGLAIPVVGCSILSTTSLAKAEGDILLAQSGTYRCESYNHISGKTRYRLSPPIPCSFIKGVYCYVLVSSKTCEYKTVFDEWEPCIDEFHIPGDITIVEDDNGKQYYKIFINTQFRLR